MAKFNFSRIYSSISSKRMAVLAAIVFAFFAVASEEDEDYRHEVMEAIGAQTAALRSVLEEKVPYPDHVAIHVNALADLASIVHTLFPEGTATDHALAVIWEEPEEFAQAVERFKVAAEALRETVNSGDQEAIPGKVMDMLRACKGCHDKYRGE